MSTQLNHLSFSDTKVVYGLESTGILSNAPPPPRGVGVIFRHFDDSGDKLPNNN